jgi:hypothetical protein
MFVLLTLGALHQQVKAAEEGGTVPPGGTIPPAPIDRVHGFVRVVHAAPFAQDVADSEVSICDNATGNFVGGLTELFYLTDSGYLPFDPGTYDWYVGTPDCDNVVVDIPPFNLFRDAALTIYFLGDGTNQLLTTILSVDRGGLDRFYHFPLMFSQLEDAAIDLRETQ